MASKPVASSPASLRVIALDTPRLMRHCMPCGGQSQFVCRERFRLNAHQQRLDVWLIYGCSRCEATYNYPIMSRRRRRDLGDALYHQFLLNDRETAWRYAFDAERLRRLRIPADFAVPYETAFHPAIPRWSPTEPVTFTLQLTWPCQARLDRVLASALSLSRSQVQQWVKTGRLRAFPERAHVWRRPAQSGQSVVIDPPEKWPLPETDADVANRPHTKMASQPALRMSSALSCLACAGWA